MPVPRLSIQNLSYSFFKGGENIRAVCDLSLSVEAGTVHALVGESGAGKSVTAKAVLRLNPEPPGRVTGGKIVFNGYDLLEFKPEAMRDVRGAQIAMVFQEPSRFLDPSMTVESQIAEMFVHHTGVSWRAARAETRNILALVELGHSDRIAHSYPHELSGGMKQRVMLAIALSCRPLLLIADEPTTALDAWTRGQILTLLEKVIECTGVSVLLISHDLESVRQLSGNVSIMYAGSIVERGPAEEVISSPRHPYTCLLFGSAADFSRRGSPLPVMRGSIPDASRIPPGCSFHPRCPFSSDECRYRVPGHVGSGSHTAACLRLDKIVWN